MALAMICARNLEKLHPYGASVGQLARSSRSMGCAYKPVSPPSGALQVCAAVVCREQVIEVGWS